MLFYLKAYGIPRVQKKDNGVTTVTKGYVKL